VLEPTVSITERERRADARSTTERAPSAAITLHDVAHAAGVSVSTASRALNGSSRQVSEPFRQRVEKAAAGLGYTANLLAQATARGNSAIIALLVADIADPYFGQIAAGVARGADEAGLIVTIAVTERDQLREARLVRALRGQHPRAIILAASRTAEPVDPGLRNDLAALSCAGGQVVTMGPGDGTARSVTVDNASGARALGVALGERGYREALVLAAGEGVLTSDERVTGFREGFAAAGGGIRRIYRGDYSRESGQELMGRALIDGIDPGTLVFAVSDVVAIGAIIAVNRAGRGVGGDIALCGFDDIPAARDVTPRLTTVRVPLEEFGYRALRAAIGEDGAIESAPLLLEVILRESTPPRAPRDSRR